jgi:hypothetical protein
MDRLHRDFKYQKQNRLNDIKFFRQLADSATNGLSTLYTIVDMNEFRFKNECFFKKTRGYYQYSKILDASPQTFDNIEEMFMKNVLDFNYEKPLKRSQ